MPQLNDDDLFDDEPQTTNSKASFTLPKGSMPWIVGGLCILITLPGMLASFPATMAERERVKAELDNISRLKVDEMTQQSLALIAETRYANGCRFVVSKLDSTQAAALGEGINVIDIATNGYLPSGTIACDFVGNTAVLESVDLDGDGIPNPAATDFAFTGNAKVVQQAMQAAGFDAQLSNPRN